MKAYMVTDTDGYYGYTAIAFGETRGQAIVNALASDIFNDCDLRFIEMSAVREKVMDKYYRGVDVMDWEDMEDRYAMVKELHFCCGSDWAELEICKDCKCKDMCDQYESMMFEGAHYDGKNSEN